MSTVARVDSFQGIFPPNLWKLCTWGRFSPWQWGKTSCSSYISPKGTFLAMTDRSTFHYLIFRLVLWSCFSFVVVCLRSFCACLVHFTLHDLFHTLLRVPGRSSFRRCFWMKRTNAKLRKEKNIKFRWSDQQTKRWPVLRFIHQGLEGQACWFPERMAQFVNKSNGKMVCKLIYWCKCLKEAWTESTR